MFDTQGSLMPSRERVCERGTVCAGVLGRWVRSGPEVQGGARSARARRCAKLVHLQTAVLGEEEPSPAPAAQPPTSDPPMAS